MTTAATIIALAGVGALEAFIYLYRYRSAAKDAPRLHNAIATALVTASRALFIAIGVSAMLGGAALWGMIAYIAAATIASDIAHQIATRLNQPKPN